MKKKTSYTIIAILIPVIIAVLASLPACAQNNKDYCQTEDFGVISPGYIAPKSVSLSLDYFTKIGLVIGAGGVYTVPKKYEVKQGENTYQEQTNSMDIYSYVGWRIFRIDYTVSIFAIGGYTMGDVENFQPFTSLKLLFPVGTKAVSVEPVYVFGRGMGAKLSFHFKF